MKLKASALAAFRAQLSTVKDGLGVTDKELADLVGTSAGTLRKWRNRKSDFFIRDAQMRKLHSLESIVSLGKEAFDDKGGLKEWIREKPLSFCGGTPLEFLMKNEYQRVRQSLAVLAYGVVA